MMIFFLPEIRYPALRLTRYLGCQDTGTPAKSVCIPMIRTLPKVSSASLVKWQLNLI